MLKIKRVVSFTVKMFGDWFKSHWENWYILGKFIMVTIFYWAETRTKFSLVYIKIQIKYFWPTKLSFSFFAGFKIDGFAIFLKKLRFLLFYLKIFKITKWKRKFMKVLRTIQIIAFYIKTDFPISKNYKN
jgi:hypothetical protein